MDVNDTTQEVAKPHSSDALESGRLQAGHALETSYPPSGST